MSRSTNLKPQVLPVGTTAAVGLHQPIMRTDKLVKIYGGRAVVNGVDIEVRRGEIVGLLGPNGAGKTTSFYMIVGLVRPNSGRVYFHEKEVSDLPMYQRARLGMGYLPQEESIFRKLTVEQNLLAILETQPMNKRQRNARCAELLTQFGIEHVAKQLALTLSGGEKRRLTIARSLVTNPSMIMLDEPFSGVDPIAVADVQQHMRICATPASPSSSPITTSARPSRSSIAPTSFSRARSSRRGRRIS